MQRKWVKKRQKKWTNWSFSYFLKDKFGSFVVHKKTSGTSQQHSVAAFSKMTEVDGLNFRFQHFFRDLDQAGQTVWGYFYVFFYGVIVRF